MGDQRKMRRLDMSKDFSKLKVTDQYFIKKLEKMNVERASDMKSLRKRNLFTGLLIGGGVIGIYIYSMFAVKQETFLDDFEKMPDEKKASV